MFGFGGRPVADRKIGRIDGRGKTTVCRRTQGKSDASEIAC